MTPRIIIESHIPFIKGVFEPQARVTYLPASDITAQAMAEADALITRTRVKVDARLLAHSPCSIVASATIGLDHVDTGYCSSHGIEVTNAPGCSAPAVAQYVISSLSHIRPSLKGLTLGVVGAGHVGAVVARWAENAGMRVLLNDPPLAETHPDMASKFVSLEQIAAEADAITFHTPLTNTGRWPTRWLADSAFFSMLRRRPVIINSARGPVVCTGALLEAMDAGNVSHAVIDCWEDEPNISTTLLREATIATPHIAGYSLQGKVRATRMAVDAVVRHFGLTTVELEVPTPPLYAGSHTELDIAASYDPAIDTLRLRQAGPEGFESLRNNYYLRPEPGF